LGQKKRFTLSVYQLTGSKWAMGVLAASFLLGAATCNAQFPLHKKKVNKSTSVDNNAQPDKVLYDKAIDDIKHGRHEVGRLGMQTLINTYPDSEYLAKAKLAIADSYYKEGGTANLALAISGYNDFVVFFPFLPEATYAQMQVAMAHYRQMEKPDRDRSQALDAEEAFQTFLQKYPNDPLAPQAQQHLRDVQEILAEGDFRIGYYYYLKGDRRAAATRLLSVANRYPLYSKSDRVLWMMGDIFEKSEKKDFAGAYYGRIVKNYPLSPLVPDAKGKLKAFGQPVPQPDPNAVTWMTAEANAPRPKASMVKKPLALLHSGPESEMRLAARSGTPQMAPESDSMSLGDLLKPTGSSGTAGKGALIANVAAGSSGSATAETVGNTSDAAGTATTESGAASAGDAPKDSQPAPASGTATPDPAAQPNATTPAATTEAPKNPAAAENATSSSEKTDATATDGDAKAADANATAAGDAAKSADSQTSGDAKDSDKDKKESSSKKKKGLKKLVPW
jgi:outer membrane protein assembly factor BamD